MTYTHLFFDLDHTLWDFEKNSTETLHELIIKHELPLRGIRDAADFIENYKTINSSLWGEYQQGRIRKEELRVERFVRALARYGIDDADLAAAIAEEYLDISPTKKNLFPYTHETLRYLWQKYSLHIVTNGFEEVQSLKLTHTNLHEYFNHIITSERAECKKPDCNFFDFALRTAGAKRSESIVIGDNLEADIKGALGAGIDCIYFNPEKLEHEYKPTHEIKCLSELQEIL